MRWVELLNSDRRRATTSPGDHRLEFERDFDRAVFSTPVKRLSDKAQVFPLEPHDAIRTRLTHSLEVSSVARGLATRVSQWLLDATEISPGMDRSIEAIAGTCGLIHDLGNPPFGHAGEDAIRAWFARAEMKDTLASLGDEQMAQDFLKFEGNAQSLRLVATLQVLADYTGLNLTFGTLSALMKYVASSTTAHKKAANRALRKPGYFASENEIVAQVRSMTLTGEARNPICFMVEAADDIVYLAADVEDAVKKGVMGWDQVEQWIKRSGGPSVETSLLNMERILKAGRDAVPAGLEDDIYASALRTAAIGVMVDAVFRTFQTRYVEIMNGEFEGALLKASDAHDLESALRTLGEERVYQTASTLKLEFLGRHVIWDLMSLFWEGAQALPKHGVPEAFTFSGKSAALFSPNYRRVFQHFMAEKRHLPETYHRLQLVTDYVCGMTDSFAKRLHSELFNGA